MSDITEEDVRSLIDAWFGAVAGKLPIEDQRRFFAPGVVIDTWAGGKVPLEAQIRLHDTLTDEGHVVNSLDIRLLADGQLRAIADVTWQATKFNDGGRIVADADEDWTIERGPDGWCRFAGYLTSSMRYRPGSAELDL